MRAQVFSVPGQTNGRIKAFLKWGGGNVNYYKSVYHPIRTGGSREQHGNFQNISVTSPFS